MSKHLVLVESPAKAKTIKKYLGKDYQVLATYGHVRDLLPKEGSVDTEHNFEMTYRNIERNEKHIEAIAKAMKKADALYLATDPDREGEAISWHISEILKQRGLLEDKKVVRVVFHEITKRAIQESFDHARELSMEMVNAQQARRALDFLVGFNLSPLLWKKIRPGLSAGRVQSPALRLIVEREQEIEKFEPREYWTIEADCGLGKQTFPSRLTYFEGNKLSQFTITDDAAASKVKQVLTDASKGTLKVLKVERKKRKRNPAAPFTTSTLQQEASRKLGFTAQRTMRVAQQLYEGVDVGSGTAGLISYMRTDSVNLANEALDEIRTVIEQRYGKDKLPKTPHTYKTKAKNAQEAHEAIRPTAADRDPDSIKEFLDKDQLKLYTLIWKRTIACQMIHASMDMVGIDMDAGGAGVFRANGTTVVDPGFMAVYQEDMDDAKKDEAEGRILPPMEEGDSIKLEQIRNEQHFTEPPPRYTEASLVKTLEEHGIGRPSTYASIISTLQQREYVELDKRRFQPTDVGVVTNRFLTQHFTQYVDYNFTANLEDELDDIARGEKEWIPLMKNFWAPFKKLVVEKDKTVERKDVTHEAMDEDCPKCGKPLSIRLGRRGRFVGCTAYPECDYTRNVGDDGESTEPEIIEDRKCPDCGGDLVIKWGRYGKFIGCGSYPDCKHIEPLEKPQDMGVECPECHKGSMLKRKSRRGKIFFSCSEYPGCKYAVWNEPINEKCPDCNWPMLTIKTTKKRGTEKVCPQQDCKFTEPYERPEAEETDDEKQAAS